MEKINIEISSLTNSDSLSSTEGFEMVARDLNISSMLKGNQWLSPYKEYLFPTVKWRLCVGRFNVNSSRDFISFYLCCTSDSKEFAGCLVKVKFKLVSQKEGVNDFTREFIQFFDKNKRWRPVFMLWDNVVNIEKGYIKNGRIVLKVEVWDVSEPPRGGSWDSRLKTGYVGLANDASLPYLSPLLQILFFTNQLRNAIYGLPASSKNGERNVTLALQRIFYELQFSEKVVAINEFLKLLIKFHQSCVEYNYEEYLRFLINSIVKDTKDTSYEGISNLFMGEINTIIKCKNIDCESMRTESFFEIHLLVEGNSNIYEGIKEFVKVEMLEGDCKYDAGVHGFQEATRYTQFKLLPSVLYIHLMRFRYDTIEGCSKKINSRFEFYEEINLAECADFQDDIDTKYTLHAALVHSNEEIPTSYFAYIRPNMNRSWFKFDGDIVFQVKKREAIERNFGDELNEVSRSAIMLVYIRNSELKHILQQPVENNIIKIKGCPPMRVFADFPTDFTSFLDNKYFSDISVQLGKNMLFSCHRLFLCNESLYFKNWFSNEKNQCESTIDLSEHNLDINAFESVLKYVYGGKCDVTLRNVFNVFKVATILQINWIQKQSVGFVKRRNLLNEIYQMLKIAKQFGDAQMCEVISSLILVNYDYLVDSSIKSLNFNEMCFLIARGDKVIKNHKYLLESVLKWATEVENGSNYLTDLLNQIDLKKIKTQDIKDLCKAHYITNFESSHNPYPIFIRLLLDDEDVNEDIERIDKGNVTDNDDPLSIDECDSIMHISKKETNCSHFFSNSMFSDICVRLGIHVIKCHRVLLAGNSPFFYAMFTNPDFLENVNKEVILNLDFESFTVMLNLIYSGCFVITSENISNLIEVSAFLQMDVACEKCIAYSQNHLVCSNVVDVYMIAYHHDIIALIEITKNIILANLQYLTKMGFLKSVNIFGFRSLIAGSINSKTPEAHLLTAILKWVMSAKEERINFMSELLSTIDLSSITKNNVSKILNENTDHTFRSSNLTELGPILERLIKDDSNAEIIAHKEKSIYLVMKVNNKYFVNKCNYDLNKCKGAVTSSGLNAVYEDSTDFTLKIGVSGKKVHALKWTPLENLQFMKLALNTAKNNHFQSICSPENKPVFHTPQNHRELENEKYYVIPGMESFTVFCDIENAVFHIFDESNSTWNVQTLCEHSLFPKYDQLLVAGENNLVVITGVSHSDFKLVDIRTNAIISIPKPQVLKDDAAILLFCHRLYLFSVHHDVRKSAMYDLFTNKWSKLPDIPPASGKLFGCLQSAAVGSFIHVFETRKLSNNNNIWYKSFVHHFDVFTQKWSISDEMPAIILHAIAASTNY